MRNLTLVGAVFLAGCPVVHASDAKDPCGLAPSDEWELLSTPPPESEQMLALTLNPGTTHAAGAVTQKDAWFHSKDGAFRFCQYRKPTDQCDMSASYLDFQRRGGSWYVASAGSFSHCPAYPQKCRPRPIDNTDNRGEGNNVEKPVAHPVALRSIAERLAEEWSPPSSNVYMAITLQKHIGKEFMHFCIENTTMHSLDLNESTLPWNVPELVTFTVLNASGKTVFKSSPFIDRIIRSPMPHSLNAADSLEGDIEFSRFPFYAAAAREDLLVMWSEPIERYAQALSDVTPLPASGILFVPKH
jgi:hypothetical protein